MTRFNGSRGMAQTARRDAGLTREGLYKALAADGNPSFAPVVKVLAPLGLCMHVGPAWAARAQFEGGDSSLDFLGSAVSDRGRRRVVQRGQR